MIADFLSLVLIENPLGEPGIGNGRVTLVHGEGGSVCLGKGLVVNPTPL